MRAMEGLLSFHPYCLAAWREVNTILHNRTRATHSLHQHETLGIGDDLGGIEALFKILEEGSLVSCEAWSGTGENLGGTSTLIFDGTQATRKDSLTNESDRHAKVESVDGSPLARTLLTSRVQDFLDEWLAVVVVEAKDVSSDFDEERVEDAIVPFRKDIAHLLVAHSQTAVHDVVGLNLGQRIAYPLLPTKSYLANQLHVTILDTVVDHFDIVASTLIADPVAARLAIRLGSNALEDVLDVWPGLFITTRHQRRAIAGTLFASGNTSTDKADTFLGKVFGSTVAVWVVGVSAVNDDVALVAVREQLLDEVVDGRTSHDQKHHTAGFLELGDELLDRLGSDDGFACGSVNSASVLGVGISSTLGLILEEAVDLGNRSVEGNDGETVIGSVEDQILAHDRKANETEITTGFGLRRTDPEAGQSRTNVSILLVN